MGYYEDKKINAIEHPFPAAGIISWPAIDI